VDDETDKATVEGLEQGLLVEMNITYHSCWLKCHWILIFSCHSSWSLHSCSHVSCVVFTHLLFPYIIQRSYIEWCWWHHHFTRSCGCHIDQCKIYEPPVAVI
jgi:hypothetical protein